MLAAIHASLETSEVVAKPISKSDRKSRQAWCDSQHITLINNCSRTYAKNRAGFNYCIDRVNRWYTSCLVRQNHQ